jgi:hypothetical protein
VIGRPAARALVLAVVLSGAGLFVAGAGPVRADDEPPVQARGSDPAAREALIRELVRGGGRFGPERPPSSGEPAILGRPESALGRRLLEGLGLLIRLAVELREDAGLGPRYAAALLRVAGLLESAPGREADLAGSLVREVDALLAQVPPGRRPPLERIRRLLAPVPSGVGVPSVPFLGAEARPSPTPRGVALEVLEVPAGSLAAEVGLEPGDRVLAVQGERVATGLLARLEGLGRGPGQLRLRVLRRDQRVEIWDLEILEAAPDRPSDVATAPPGEGRSP